MEVIFSPKSQTELDKVDSFLRKLFLKHIEKMKESLPRRHLKFGLPFNVEEVTQQARIVYETQDNAIFIIHCFSRHKDYEKWYKSYK